MDEYEGDVAYEVWRRGGNPDLINWDRVADNRYDYDAEEAAEIELHYQKNRRGRSEQAGA